jgi:hypothetical protein
MSTDSIKKKGWISWVAGKPLIARVALIHEVISEKAVYWQRNTLWNEVQFRLVDISRCCMEKETYLTSENLKYFDFRLKY